MPIITKSDGSTQTFERTKLISSLKRAGAASDIAESIADDIEHELKDGMTTHEIYSRAFTHLREHRRPVAARYSLKRAVLEFGPSGFPFESYLGELFRLDGYDISTDRHIRGRCVEHEVDVLLQKGEEYICVEAKFHNSVGFKTDLQVALYVEARLEDIRSNHEHTGRKVSGILATNTKFTSLAVAYANCKNLGLLGWEYPEENNLHDRIEKAHLYPITALTTLSRSEKVALMNEGVVLCRDLTRHEDALKRAGVRPNVMQEVLMEAGGLCAAAAEVQLQH